MKMKYDVIVVGGGHAGIEASCAPARMGCSTALITLHKDTIGRMSCNPAVGGSAKGHLVHEIDALGGMMGLIADKTGIQFRILNKSKGPAIWASRCQSDRKLYSEEAARVVSAIENLDIIEDSVIDVIAENGVIKGVRTEKGIEYECLALIICSGTFLNGVMFTGLNATKGGRFGEKQVVGLTESLNRLGFKSGRLKTGTPPRIDKNTINFNVLEEQPGDDEPNPFSMRTDKSKFPFLPQLSCFITHTDENVHNALRKGFDRSPMFTGVIKGTGPRYCPSIEDKIVRFSDKEKHHLFLEPEGLDDNLYYLNGFPTSLPSEVQEEAVHLIKGLEECKIVRYGYAIEYDFFPPEQVDLTLETKLIKGLYFAGQINGTSGYEEAAAQGIIAGINAALKIQGKSDFILKRSQAYTGVLIDDLVTKSTEEPYRMFTSRAEHRLLLRQDNADRRLLKYGYEFGLITKEMYEDLCEREIKITKGKNIFNKTKLKSSQINKLLESKNTSPIDSIEIASKLLKRPELKIEDLLPFFDDMIVEDIFSDPRVLQQIEIEIKYEGYIQQQQEMILKLEKYDDLLIPLNFNYFNLNSIKSEAKEKLARHKPRSIGQASRISGITPSDISILLVYLKK